VGRRLGGRRASRVGRTSTISSARARGCASGSTTRALLATSNPTGGARAWHLSFTRSTLTPEHLGCASPHLCVVTADDDNDGPLALVSTNPLSGLRSWHQRSLPGDLYMFNSKVSCPSAHLCAIGGPDYVITSTHLAARRPHWRFRRVPFGGDLSCPGVHLCLAITGAGEVPGFLHKPSEVIVSRNPAGGRTAWHAAPLTAGVGAVVSLACPSSRRCVAVDERDQVITTQRRRARRSRVVAARSFGRGVVRDRTVRGDGGQSGRRLPVRGHAHPTGSLHDLGGGRHLPAVEPDQLPIGEPLRGFRYRRRGACFHEPDRPPPGVERRANRHGAAVRQVQLQLRSDPHGLLRV